MILTAQNELGPARRLAPMHEGRAAGVGPESAEYDYSTK